MVKTRTFIAVSIFLLMITLSGLISLGNAAGGSSQRSLTPTYSENSDQVVFQTGILVAVINKNVPTITFYYQPDGGNVGKFKLTYNSIIAYNDTGNGIFDEDETVYQSTLSSGAWVASPVMGLEDEGHGRYLVFSMNSSITMTPTGSRQGSGNHGGGPSSPITNWATMTLTFMLANRSYTQAVSNQLAYNVSGNTELKIGIRLVISKGLAAKNMTLEQYLYENEDLTGDHVFRLHESTGVTSRNSRNRESGPHGLVMHRFNYATQIEQRIAFASSEEVEEGYYSWIAPVNFTRSGGSISLVNLTTSYAISGSEMRLYYSLPYSVDYQSIYFDPVIGIIESGFLAAIADFVAEHSNSLITGLMIGGVIVVGVLYLVSRKESGKEEDVTDLVRNPYYAGKHLNLLVNQ
nr:hypothetical protein [Candidatus Njordarchaeota archaeon]